MRTRRVIVLGSTGSIGRQTLEVIASLNALGARGEHPCRYDVVGLCAGQNHDALLAQAVALNVRDVALASPQDVGFTAADRALNLRQGIDAAERLVREVDADLVVAAIVGSAGLRATLAAVELGRDVALANKETLVAAGALVVAACERTGARLLPVDSEHCAIWQCLAGHTPADAAPASPGAGGTRRAIVPPITLDAQVRRLVLTASGGALRDRSVRDTYHATPDDALRHPVWSMGAKVTIDSASLTNKALELIEAHWLFGLPAERLDAIIHPQSIIHSFVEFADGCVVAQLGVPDMRAPIQFALTFPDHTPGPARSIDWRTLTRLDLSTPDAQRFPALAIGRRVIEEGGTSGAVFNAANEAAVEAFLARAIPFGRIAELSAAALDEVGVSPLRDLADVMEADEQARRFVHTSLQPQGAR